MRICSYPVSVALSALVIGLLFASAPDASAEEERSVSRSVGAMYTAVLEEIRMHPDVLAIDTVAAELGWARISDEKARRLNIPVAYQGQVEGVECALGGDGTNDVFSIVVSAEFSAEEVLREVRRAIRVEEGGKDVRMGNRIEMHRLMDKRTRVGFLTFTYGTSPSLRGVGTVAFVSEARAAKSRRER